MAAPCPVFGFLLETDLAPLSATEAQALWTSFAGLLRSRGLECDGGTSSRRWSCLIVSEASQVTDADRQAVQDWAARHPEIVGIRLGPLADISAW